MNPDVFGIFNCAYRDQRIFLHLISSELASCKKFEKIKPAIFDFREGGGGPVWGSPSICLSDTGSSIFLSITPTLHGVAHLSIYEANPPYPPGARPSIYPLVNPCPPLPKRKVLNFSAYLICRSVLQLSPTAQALLRKTGTGKQLKIQQTIILEM